MSECGRGAPPPRSPETAPRGRQHPIPCHPASWREPLPPRHAPRQTGSQRSQPSSAAWAGREESGHGPQSSKWRSGLWNHGLVCIAAAWRPSLPLLPRPEICNVSNVRPTGKTSWLDKNGSGSNHAPNRHGSSVGGDVGTAAPGTVIISGYYCAE